MVVRIGLAQHDDQSKSETSALSLIAVVSTNESNKGQFAVGWLSAMARAMWMSTLSRLQNQRVRMQ